MFPKLFYYSRFLERTETWFFSTINQNYFPRICDFRFDCFAVFSFCFTILMPNVPNFLIIYLLLSMYTFFLLCITSLYRMRLKYTLLLVFKGDSVFLQQRKRDEWKSTIRENRAAVGKKSCENLRVPKCGQIIGMVTCVGVFILLWKCHKSSYHQR